MVFYPRSQSQSQHQKQQSQQSQQSHPNKQQSQQPRQQQRQQQSHPNKQETPNTHPDDAASLATAFLGRYGWGAQGRMLGISRMFQPNDVTVLKIQTVVCSQRPRGVLSGFLAIAPSLGHAVYIPPIGGKIPARSIRMRISEEILQDGGAILSAYWDGPTLVLEDVLVWKGQPVWQTQTFQDRWMRCMQSLNRLWQPDDLLQGCTIRFAEYMSLDQLEKPDAKDATREVLEFVPTQPNTKRMIWLPNTEEEEADHQILVAHREVAIGPDVFSVWRQAAATAAEAPEAPTPVTEVLEVSERLGIAYIRSLAISRQLRQYVGDVFRVKTTWHKGFERHEIVGIVGS